MGSRTEPPGLLSIPSDLRMESPPASNLDSPVHNILTRLAPLRAVSTTSQIKLDIRETHSNELCRMIEAIPQDLLEELLALEQLDPCKPARHSLQSSNIATGMCKNKLIIFRKPVRTLWPNLKYTFLHQKSRA